MDRRLGRQQAELVRRAHHRPFDEEAVDTAGIVDRVDQPAAGLEVERQRTGAEMDVEVEQSRLAAGLLADRPGRSEEHTSELQSLMRISYAVFCLNKKQIQYIN